MLRLLATVIFLVYLIGPVGDVVVGAMETGYAARESNARLAVGVAQNSAGSVEVVPMEEYVASEAREVE